MYIHVLPCGAVSVRERPYKGFKHITPMPCAWLIDPVHDEDEDEHGGFGHMLRKRDRRDSDFRECRMREHLRLRRSHCWKRGSSSPSQHDRHDGKNKRSRARRVERRWQARMAEVA